MIFRNAAVLLLLGTIAMGSVQAGEAIQGRWAADPENCASEASLLIVEALSLRWRDAACTVKRSYRLKDSWHIGARCSTEGAAADVPLKLEMRGDRLLLEWASAPPRELSRCP
jgi:hypothetical protein